MSTAAPFAGVSARSAQSWLARGREGELYTIVTNIKTGSSQKPLPESK